VLDGLPLEGDAAAMAVHPDGRRVATRVRVEPWQAPGERLFIVLLDGIERSEAKYRELEEAKRMTSLRRLAATMAHEFNNVLAGIGTFADYLNRRAVDDEIRRAASHIGLAIRRGRTITDEILRYTRAMPPVLADVAVRAWLEAFLPEANALTGGRTLLEPGPALFI